MRKLRTLIGMPVVCGHRRIGRLIGVDLSDDLRRLRGVWISAGLTGTRYISAEQLELLGQVAVLTDSRGVRRRMTARPGAYRAISSDGGRLGAITGFEIDELSFVVTALELSTGLWDDLLGRRQRITRYTVNRETGSVIVRDAGQEGDAKPHEGRNDQGPGDRDADRRFRRDDLRRDELAD